MIDRINEANATPHIGSIRAVNPCGEQPLLDYESCNLGSINVSAYVDADAAQIQWDALGRDIAAAVRFLDDVIDANCWPLEDMKAVSLGNRKIGLGVMGVWDAMVLLRIAYNSEQAIRFVNQLMEFIDDRARLASGQLAGSRGRFPNWKGSVWDTKHSMPLRNATLTTIAPTGSISIIADCSSGIEPPYSLAYLRRALDGQEYVQVHPLIRRLGTQQGWLSPSVVDRLLAGESACQIVDIPESLATTMATSLEIDPEWHVRVQAAFQRHVDNAVSKTVNLPESASRADVDRVFRLAFTQGCKGITVYRNQSRPQQVLSLGVPSKLASVEQTVPRNRPRSTSGTTSKYRMGCGTLYVTVNRDDAGLCEVFANLGKGGGCPAQTEATCRIISAALRCGVDPAVLTRQLRGIRCLSAAVARKNGNDLDVMSCPDAIARAIAANESADAADQTSEHQRVCPDCNKVLKREAGCFVCTCGYSSCA